jgi:hypothetical protein
MVFNMSRIRWFSPIPNWSTVLGAGGGGVWRNNFDCSFMAGHANH